MPTQVVPLTSGEITVPAYYAGAVEASSGVVVLQEIFGVNAHIRDVTERFAQAGYSAIAPALYQRQVPDFETGYSPDDIEIGRRYKVRTQADELLQDVQAAVDYLKQQGMQKIGCVGFCFGGHVAYLAATLPDMAATASFYGAGIATWCPGDVGTTLARTPEISGELYGFFGKEDASIPAMEVDQIEAALQLNGVPHQLFRYSGAGHGFFCDRRDSYRPEAAADAWERVLTLFARTLG